MTVRITKPEFNLREKLSELDNPIGVHGSQLMRSESGAESFSLVRAGRKNMIINGAMSINQRNGGSSFTIPHASGGSYGGPDRWAVNEATGGEVSVNMDGDPATANAHGVSVQEFSKAFQIACSVADGNLGSTANVHFFQNIEGHNITHLGWGTPTAKPVTLSFWIKTNKAGFYAVGLENSAVDRCCIRDYHQTGDSKWNKVILTFPGCTDGTWLTDNGIGIRVRFCLASGDNFDDGDDGEWVNSDELCTLKSKVVNFMDSTNNRFFITGVQLEEGTVATSFEHRSYEQELSLCQRYYERHNWIDSQYVALSGQHQSASATSSRFVFPFLTRKRTTDPSFTASGNYRGFPPSSGGEAVTLTGGEDNDTSVRVNVARITSFAGGTAILILSYGDGNYFEVEDEL